MNQDHSFHSSEASEMWNASPSCMKLDMEMEKMARHTTTPTLTTNGSQECSQGTQGSSTTEGYTHTSKRSRMITTPPRSTSRTITRLPFYSSSPSAHLKEGKMSLRESEKQQLCGRLFTSPESKSDLWEMSNLSEMTLSETQSLNTDTQMENGHCPSLQTSRSCSFTEEQTQEKHSGQCTALRIPSWCPTWTTSADGTTSTMESSSMTCPSHISQENHASTCWTGKWTDPFISDTRQQRSPRKRVRFSPRTSPSTNPFLQTSLEQFVGVSPRLYTSRGLPTGSPTDNWMRIKLVWNTKTASWDQHKRSETPSP